MCWHIGGHSFEIEVKITCHLLGMTSFRGSSLLRIGAQPQQAPAKKGKKHEAFHRPPRSQPSPGADVFG